VPETATANRISVIGEQGGALFSSIASDAARSPRSSPTRLLDKGEARMKQIEAVAATRVSVYGFPSASLKLFCFKFDAIRRRARRLFDRAECGA
jgi:hypothetical protein